MRHKRAGIWLRRLAPLALAGSLSCAHADQKRALQFAWNILDDPAHAVADAERLVREARARGDDDLLLDALVYAREAWMENYQDAPHPVEKEGVALARKLARLGEYCVMLRAIGGEKERAEIARTSQDCQAASILDDLYHAAFERRNAETLALLEKGYPMWQARGDVPRMLIGLSFASYSFMGFDYLPRDDASMGIAESFTRRMLAVAEPHPPRYYVALERRQLALILHNRHEDEEVESMLHDSLSFFRAMGYPNQVGQTQYLLATVAFDAGRYAEALRLSDESWPAMRAKRTWDGRVAAPLLRARALAHLGRAREALAALATAKAGVGTPTVESVVYLLGAAEVHATLGNYALAYQAMKDWRGANDRLQAESRAAEAQELSTRFQVALGDKEIALLRSHAAEADARRRQLAAQQLAIAVSLGLAVLLLAVLALRLRRRAAAAHARATHDRELAAAAETANRAKSTFLAHMSHELRSPLNAMLGFSRLLLRDESLSPGPRHDAGIILQSGEHLYRLINQVLEVSKIEAGRETILPVAVEPRRLLDEIERSFTLAARQKDVGLSVTVGDDVPRRVSLDATKMRQVLLNIVGNAVKFTARGDVILSLAVRDDRLAFVVEDAGPGMTSGELARLGETFIQFQAGRQASEGTGLGLAISRAFVGLLGGQLRFDSVPGRGTTVSFDVPMVPVEEDDRGPVPPRRVAGVAADDTPRRILIVDDLPPGRLLVSRLLRPLGFELREACDGQEAVAQWQAWAPHLILMDMRMPVMDGGEATRRIKATPQGRETVVVALTASSFEEQREEILALGCDDFLRKPFTEEALFEVLARHLHLEPVYEPETDDVSDPTPDAARLAALPTALRERLREALRRLEVPAVQRAIAEMNAVDAQSADALRPLIERFQYEIVERLLRGEGRC